MSGHTGFCQGFIIITASPKFLIKKNVQTIETIIISYVIVVCVSIAELLKSTASQHSDSRPNKMVLLSTPLRKSFHSGPRLHCDYPSAE